MAKKDNLSNIYMVFLIDTMILLARRRHEKTHVHGKHFLNNAIKLQPKNALYAMFAVVLPFLEYPLQ